MRKPVARNVRGIGQHGKASHLPAPFRGFLYTAEITSTGFHPISQTGEFSSLTGFPAGRFTDGDFYVDSIVARSDANRVRKFRERVSAGTGPRSIEYAIVSRSGGEIRVREFMIPRRKTGDSVVIAGLVIQSDGRVDPDPGGRGHPGDRELRELQKLNYHLIEVNQLKDEFLANTSHELRTPLNSIIGFLTLITEGYYENDDELRLFTKNALDSSYHLLNVINDLLDISKIESGRMQLQIERIYVKELVEEVVASFMIQAAQKGLNIESDVHPGGMFAAADLRRLKQVLINLTGNAIKFTFKGKVEIEVRPDGKMLLFLIKDSGIGIQKKRQDKLFQKFVQVEGGSTRRFGGTGLGLAISKHLVEMMGGNIGITSRGPNMGTTVRFSVPRWTKEE